MYKNHTKCRACGSHELTPVFDLGVQHLANDFCGESEKSAGIAPLKVLLCERCTLAQLSVVVDPELLYRHYNYLTSDSPSMLAHFKTLADAIEESSGTGSVLEIGSNDGSFLAFLKKRGFGPVLGIDPAQNLSEIATAKGVETLTSVFSPASAENAKTMLGKVDTIIARHVFCHVDDWRDFLYACASISHGETLICLEVPYVLDLLKKSEFDTIYHEHTSYLSIESIKAALQGTGLVIQRVKRYPVHGGAVLLVLRKGEQRWMPPGDEIPITAELWREFGVRSKEKIDKLKTLVCDLVRDGKSVAGYGASAKSTVWINSCKFSDNEIRFISDNTPQKIGRYSPGTKIPIVDERDLLTLMPDFCVLFAWNFLDDVIAKNRDYLGAGGRFIVPSPDLVII